MIVAFDPADWLRRFTAAGGWYAAQGHAVHTGWRMDSIEQAAAARQVWAEIEHDTERRYSVRSLVAAGSELLEG